VETIPDAFATLGNVTGDLAATTVVAKGTPQTDEVSEGETIAS
jgi:Na+/H+-dicarboxylate symporter